MRALGLLVYVFLLAVPTVALAERGALTVEVAAGAGGGAVPTPLAAPGGGGHAPAVTPHGGVAVRYAFTHDLVLGISAGHSAWRRLTHPGVVLRVPDPATGLSRDWPGDLSHDYADAWLVVTGRWYLAGFDWRAFVEPRIGWSRQQHRNLQHRRQVGDGLEAYPLGDLAHAVDGLLVGLSPGLEHVWDRMAVGIRGEAAWVVGPGTLKARLVAHAAWDFYP